MKVKKTTVETPIEQSQGKMFILVGLTHLVEDEGCTPHEAFRILEDLKRESFHALSQIHRGEG